MKNPLRERLDALLESRAQRTVALILAIVVTFSTTYSLVLPAITLEKETAETMSGLSLGGNEQARDSSASSEGEGTDGGDGEEKDSDPVSFDAEVKNEDGETETLVHVEADADAFPEGTTMEASLVTDQDVIDSIADSAEGEVVAVHAVDLSFTDENGETVQPAEGSQVSVTLSAGEGETAEVRCEENATDPAAEAEEADGGETPEDRNTETTVIQYTEENGAEPIEAADDVSLQVEPENELDTDNAVSFNLTEQTGDRETQAYAIVETVSEEEDGVKQNDFTDDAEAVAEVSDSVSPEAEEPQPEAQESLQEEELPAEETLKEPEEGILTAQDESYIVSVTYGQEAKIPQGASVKV